MKANTLADQRSFDPTLIPELRQAIGDYEPTSRLACLLKEAADEIERLRRGEFICSRCYLRKDGERGNVDF